MKFRVREKHGSFYIERRICFFFWTEVDYCRTRQYAEMLCKVYEREHRRLR